MLQAYRNTMAAGFVKVTFGDNVPGYELGDKNLPAIMVLQVSAGIHTCTNSSLFS